MEKILNWQFIGKEQMTGLPEYRNGCASLFSPSTSLADPFGVIAGGLLIDFNLLVPKIPALLTSFDLPVPSSTTDLPTLLEVPPLDPSHSAVVEMRAVTIIMLDRLAEGIRKQVGVQLSLPQVLEAGTWKAVSFEEGRARGRRGVGECADPLPVPPSCTPFLCVYRVARSLRSSGRRRVDHLSAMVSSAALLVREYRY